MTHSEYKKLVEEYYKTDSISRRKEIKDKLEDACIALLHTMDRIYGEFGFHFVDDTDYQPDNGGCTSLERFCPDEADLRYYAHWRYGGECDIGMTVETKFFDLENRLKLRSELREKRRSILKEEILDNESQIEFLKKRNEEIVSKLKKFETTEENNDGQRAD